LILIVDCHSGEIILSSRRLTIPRVPFKQAFNDDYDMILRSLRRPDRLLRSLGNGFTVLDTILPDADLQALQTTLQRLSLYTLGVEDYITGSPFGQSLVTLADQRNLIQHGLLSLIPHANDCAEPSLIHVCRLAAMIYSFLCVTPISPAPFSALTIPIQSTLSGGSAEDIWREAPELAVWIAVMAAVASTGCDSRAWFVAVLDRCLRRLKIQSWDALKALLQDFLWLPTTNDADGYDLWLEIEESSPFQLGESSTSMGDGGERSVG
jgi:hypothetical protein